MNAAEIAAKLGDATQEGHDSRCRCPTCGRTTLTLRDNPNKQSRVKLLIKSFCSCAPKMVRAELKRRGLLNGSGNGTDPPEPEPTETEEERQAREAAEAAKRQAKVDDALDSWRISYSAADSLGATYLARRLLMPQPTIPAALRFLLMLYHKLERRNYPALIGLIQNTTDGTALGIHAIFLNPLDPTSKLAIDKRKLSYGAVKGGAVCLCPPGETLAIAEGIEDALTFTQAYGIPAWSAISTEGVKYFTPPAGVKNLILIEDQDEAGREAVAGAAERLGSSGYQIQIARPKVGKDVNDALRELGHNVPLCDLRPFIPWRSLLLRNKKEEILALESNAMIMLRGHDATAGIFGLDEFTQRANLMRRPPWGRPGEQYPRPVCDADLSDLLAWLQQEGIYLHGRPAMRMILASLIRDVTFHPVRDYLRSLKWDGTRRLDNWLTYYLGVAPITHYTSEVGAKWMISAVARIFKPGCFVKYVPIIEGPQDLGKSTALRILGEPWFTDDIATLGSKDSQLQVGNAWIVELAELDSTRQANINAIKAFISRPTDQFRPPYGEHIIRQERQSVLVATINPGGAYLHDETGAVRFWPVLATSIDLDALRHERDQLWAEAVARYKDGEQWWPSADFKALNEQEARSETVESDPWFDLVRDWVDDQPATIFVNGKEIGNTFKAADILKGALFFDRDQMDRKAERRLGAILRHLGYISGGVRIGDAPPVRRWHLKPSTAGGS